VESEKAAEDSRTPKPSESGCNIGTSLAFWSAVVLYRFGLETPLNGHQHPSKTVARRLLAGTLKNQPVTKSPEELIGIIYGLTPACGFF
jgi:hypothetical protein